MDEVRQLIGNLLNRSDDLLANVAKDLNALLSQFSESKPQHAETAPPPNKEPAIKIAEAVKPDKDEINKPTFYKETVTIPSQIVTKNNENKAKVSVKSGETVIPSRDAVLVLSPTIRRVTDCKEQWLIKVDEDNQLLLALMGTLKNGALPEQLRKHKNEIVAIFSVRNSLFDEKSALLKKVGWETTQGEWDNAIIGALVGGAMYLTGGLAAVSLLSKSVRDEFMKVTMAKTWKRPNTEVELDVITHEILAGLKIVSPDAKTYTLTQLRE